MDIKIDTDVKDGRYHISIFESFYYYATGENIESIVRDMVNKAFEVTRKCKVYSYDMDLFVNHRMFDRLQYYTFIDKDINSVGIISDYYVILKDLDLKIRVLHYDFICDDIIELRIKEKKYMDYEKDLFEYKNKYWKDTINSIYGLPNFNGEIKPQPQIKKVIFSGPCTVVLWSDNTKTIVRCVDEDFDKEKGLSMAISKKFLGTNKNKSDYFDVFKEWCKED